MIVDFFFDLRAQGLKVGPPEALQVARALIAGLHDDSLEGFYDVARALCVHREADLDAFDRAFAAYFRGINARSLHVLDELAKWLAEPRAPNTLTDEQQALLNAIDLPELRKLLEDRLREQKERHDGGTKWVGTGGTSPFGNSGTHPSGIRIGQGGGRSALAVAEARNFRAYRSDIVLDGRAIEVALRKLKGLAREGADIELDIEATIDATSRQGGELELVLRPTPKPNVKVLLLMDVGGSMDPHTALVSRLFSAAKRASNFKRLEAFYFHNALYGKVYRHAHLRDGVPIPELLQQLDVRDTSWKLVLLGDALMHPGELLGTAWDAGHDDTADAAVSGIGWFQRLAREFHRAVWLNPEPERYWNGTAAMIREVLPMYELTVDGLGNAVAHLSRRTRA